VQSVTLLFLQQDNQILLAMKKRGHGMGKWNGAGGKVEEGETITQAAVRECQEEIGVTPVAPKLAGRLQFFLTEDPSFHHDCHVFVTSKWTGNLAETEEMRPEWFNLDSIPYDKMWPDDKIWLPYLIDNQLFSGNVTIATINNVQYVGNHTIKLVQELL
jgi:mutator protein MutT